MVAVVTEEVKEQLMEASAVTKKAFTAYRREVDAEEHQTAADGSPLPTTDKGQEEGEMSVIITIMQPILRLMQLLCENHNRDLQVSHYAGWSLWKRLCLNLPTCHSGQWHVHISWPLSNSVKQERDHCMLKIGTICRTSWCSCFHSFTMRSVLDFSNGWLWQPRQKTSFLHRFCLHPKPGQTFMKL